MSMYNNDDIMSKITEQSVEIYKLESTVTNLTDKIGFFGQSNQDEIMSKMAELESTITTLTTKIDILLDSDLAFKGWLKRNQEILDELGYKSVEPIEMPEFEGTDNALENLTIRKNV
jgi:hypothetical protein